MRYVLGFLALAVALCATAGASGGGYHAPTALRAFLLTPSETPQAYYPRTPSFTWNPVGRGGTYDFQLATSRSFSDEAVLFSYSKLRIPAIAVDHQLPWMTGSPDALWARVRWESPGGKIVTPWSNVFGFNMRWRDQDTPQQMSAPVGLIRWKPIEGATRYEVIYTDIHPSQSFQTTTNVADEREFFTFHDQLGWGATIHWRVRAIRYIDDKDILKNGLPRATYGPWSPVFTTVNPPKSVGTLTPLSSVSDDWGKTAHELTPGFSWQASSPVLTQMPDVGSPLYRVYVFTDNHCVNQVFAGSIVGSPAFAPRTVGGPLALPQNGKDLAKWEGGFVKLGGPEGNAFDMTGKKVAVNEMPGAAASSGSSSTSTSSSSSSSSTSTSSTSGTGAVADASVDLWDSGWPTGRYYWTIVPVTVILMQTDDQQSQSGVSIGYQDAAVSQDECESGHMMSFGKVSQPVVTASSTPFVSGLAPNGRIVASAGSTPTLHDSPLIAWLPAVGATRYEVQLSRTSYPWRRSWDHYTPATSIILPLTSKSVGTWYYRVRGINPALPTGAQAMTWSKPVRIRITGDRFVVVK